MLLDEEDINELTLEEKVNTILEEVKNLNYGGDKHDTLLDRFTDWIVGKIGSWGFVAFQTVMIFLWITLNRVSWFPHWDGPDLIKLNLIMSFEAAFALPFLLMAQNKSEAKDRRRAIDAYSSIAHIETLFEELIKSLNQKKNGKDKNGQTS